MRKLIFVLSLFLVLIIVPMAMADTVTITRVSGYFQSGFNGGEFTVVINDTSSAPDLNWVLQHYINGKTGGILPYSFQTFCVETAEYIGNNLNFDISQKAIYGRNYPYGDPISKGTAWLYAQFVKGTLTGYDYTGSGRAADAKALQETIWWLEGEGPDPGVSNKFRDLVDDLPNYTDDNNGYYPVAVLNVWKQDGTVAQDQLVYVPEPGILILLGIGLSVVGLAARRFRKI